MKLVVSIFALVSLIVSFQNCSNVKFENGDKTVHKIDEAGINGGNGGVGGGSNPGGNPGSNNGNGTPPEDNNDIPEYTEEELATATCSDGSEEGYLICHFPPGHFEGFHTLCVGRRALEAHLRHGHSGVPGHPRDLLGSCEDNF